MAHAPEPQPHKRKREMDDNGGQPGHHHHPVPLQPAGGKVNLINYLPKPPDQRLPLLPGDASIFADVISLINEHEGVLDRNESLAASLGAKLTGPRFLKGFDKFFDGPLKTDPSQPSADPIVSWLDVVTFAKSHPNAFKLTTTPAGSRCCRFRCKGVQVEIAEDDWRLISSGALDRFPLEHPFEGDETAELATLDILEQRASALYKRAEEVAARARVLHHRLGHRRQELARQRRSLGDGGGGAKFHAVNHPQRLPGPGYGSSSSYDLHADLLQQFTSAEGPGGGFVAASMAQSRPASRAGASAMNLEPASPRAEASQRCRLAAQPGPAATCGPVETAASTANCQAAVDDRAETHRSLVTQKTDKLAKGDGISPPCDRCRRLRLQCVKHLTACQGCTKKHARCSWRCVTEDEAASLRRELGIVIICPPGTEEAPAAVPGTPALEEAVSRPPSRGGRADPGSEPQQRTSLPTERSASGQTAPMPRDQARMGHITAILSPAILSPADYKHHQPFGPNAPPR